MSERFPTPDILSDGAMITLVLICAEAVLLSGCHRDPVGQALTAATAPSAVAAVPLSQLDFGVSVLADVDNARFAIQLRDRIAASNDVDGDRLRKATDKSPLQVAALRGAPHRTQGPI